MQYIMTWLKKVQEPFFRVLQQKLLEVQSGKKMIFDFYQIYHFNELL